MCGYLKNRSQSVQIDNKFISAKKEHASDPQGSTDGPLLFDLFINDSVLFLTDTFLSNYADDDTYMVLNQKKMSFICIGRNTEKDKFGFDNLILENSKEEFVLGVTIDNKSKFDSHIENICRKAD